MLNRMRRSNQNPKSQTQNRLRLDQLLVARELAESRTRAQALILAGKVRVGGEIVAKCGAIFPEDVSIEILAADHPYVSRGGVKLAHALDQFRIAVEGATALDVGASTGGFTDCLLQRGAARVYAIDVGIGQLHWKLRNDPRVVVRENCNARHLAPADFPERFDLAVADVSFISLKKILPAVVPLLKPSADVVLLIKPQFEAARSEVGKKGVVRDPRIRQRILEEFWNTLPDLGLSAVGLVASPLAGPAGNIEYLLGATTSAQPRTAPAGQTPDFAALARNRAG
ncbi:MAG: TlyA family RNA methyltransferase [Candidatus Sumerlaeia bacterium]|nr:TlyA family RNA methyltransferase [Candidatus Sumerlaeia bacterium]